MGLLESLGLWLINEQKAVAVGVDLYYDYAPPTGDCISIYEYGQAPSTLRVDALHRGIQIQVRNQKADVAKSLSWNLFHLFRDSQAEDARIDLAPGLWGQVSLRTGPMKLKVDDKGQVYWVFNLGITSNILR